MNKETKIKMGIILFLNSLLILLFILFISNFFKSYFLQTEPEKTEHTTFVYPFDNPEFMQYKNIIVSYEYVGDNRHLIAVKNNGSQYIMPLFKTRNEALDFMNCYFIYLKED